ncbi:MAG: RNA ligase RtcB family protein [Pseudomonadota bacterium]
MGISQIAGASASVTTYYGPGAWIDARAEDQLAQVAHWPGLRAVAAFPDLHPGRHGPVGAAFLADRLYPQLVGPDIGCGMALFRLDLSRRKLNLDRAVRRMRALEAPFDGAGRMGDWPGLTPHGLGTIGGGNHFCELQEVAEAGAGFAAGELCLLVHSGSRSQGADIFARLDGRWNAGFAASSGDGMAYLARHDAAVAWARLNRRLIAERAAEALRCHLEPICDAAHNLVTPLGDGWLHRKGAAEAGGALVPLAGSREAASYVLAPSAMPEATLASLSHGAGRRHDRAAMRARMRTGRADLAALARTRFGGRVVCEDRDRIVEEAGRAYKDAAAVAADLEAFGLARIVATMTPLLTHKRARAEGGR